MKLTKKIFCCIVLMLCLNGCQQTNGESKGDANLHENETMPDLKLDIENNLDGIREIEIKVSDDLEQKNGYFSSVVVKASYDEGKEDMPLIKGLSYRQKIPGEAIQARDADSICLQFSYRTIEGEEFTIGEISLTKEECWDGAAKRFILDKEVILKQKAY